MSNETIDELRELSELYLQIQGIGDRYGFQWPLATIGDLARLVLDYRRNHELKADNERST